jgi:hypothetical protein
MEPTVIAEFCDLLQHLHANSGKHFKSGHDRFLPHLFKLAVYSQPTLYTPFWLQSLHKLQTNRHGEAIDEQIARLVKLGASSCQVLKKGKTV